MRTWRKLKHWKDTEISSDGFIRVDGIIKPRQRYHYVENSEGIRKRLDVVQAAKRSFPPGMLLLKKLITYPSGFIGSGRRWKAGTKP